MSGGTPFGRTPRGGRAHRSRKAVDDGRPAPDAASRRAKGKMLINYLSYARPDVRELCPGSTSLLLDLLIEAIKQAVPPEEAEASPRDEAAPGDERQN